MAIASSKTAYLLSFAFVLSSTFAIVDSVAQRTQTSQSKANSKAKTHSISRGVKKSKSPATAKATVIQPVYTDFAPPPPPFQPRPISPELVSALSKWNISPQVWLNESHRSNCTASMLWRFDNKLNELRSAAKDQNDPVAAVLLAMRPAPASPNAQTSQSSARQTNCNPEFSPEYEALLLRPSYLNDPRALVMLAEYWLSDVSQDNDALAFTMISKAADMGSVPAIVYVAKASIAGENSSRDYSQAITLAEYAALNGSLEAMRLLGEIYDSPANNGGFPIAANIHFQRAAAAGDDVSMLILGKRAREGKGTSPDNAIATSWFKKAAEAGNVEAMSIYADALYRGVGTQRNEIEALVWFVKAANFGNADASAFLAKQRPN